MAISIVGRENHHFTINLSEENERADRLAILLPGVGYRLTNPIFYFTQQLLLDNGYRIAGVDYAYDKLEGFRDFDFETILGILRDDAASIGEAISQLPPHNDLLLIGKSLGTVLMANLLNQKHIQSARLAWLTPSAKVTQVGNKILENAQKSFVCVGTSDKGYDAKKYAGFKLAGATVSELNDLAHVLECDNDVPKSIMGHHQMILDLQNWLKANA